MDRRVFIKQGCFACMAAGTGFAALSLSSCATLPVVKSGISDNKILLDTNHFKEGIKVLVVRSAAIAQDILVIKEGDTYRALYMECTHNKNRLSPTVSTIYCNAHGAQFDLSGNVLKGPAQKRLKSFPVELRNNQLTIIVAGS